MIIIKSNREIENIRKSNLLLSRLHGELAKLLKPGISTIELDKFAEDFIRSNGGIPAFLNYMGYPNTLCVSVNDVVVHGIPSDLKLKEGDIVSIDSGINLNGYISDCAFTYAIGEVDDEVWKLMRVTLESLYKAINVAKPGNRVGDIGFTVQHWVEKHGFSVVRELTGHGVGKKLHEDPMIPNYGRSGTGKKLKPGMTIAIEPMVNMGKKEVYFDDDNWTVRTDDGSYSAHYEHSLVITENGAKPMSTFEFIYEAIEKNEFISAPKI